MLDLDRLDVDEIATALADRGGYDHRWLLDPRTGEVVFWTSDTGIDGEHPVDVDDLDLIPLDLGPTRAWYDDMADFAAGLTDLGAGTSLATALEGRGAFRRFKNEVYERRPELISSWHTFRDARGRRRAVQWLLDEGLIDDRDAHRFIHEHADPELP